MVIANTSLKYHGKKIILPRVRFSPTSIFHHLCCFESSDGGFEEWQWKEYRDLWMEKKPMSFAVTNQKVCRGEEACDACCCKLEGVSS